MKSLVQGQNTPLTARQFCVDVGWKTSNAAATIDVSAFLLTSDGKVSGDEDMIFYGQPGTTDGSISISSESPGDGGGNTFFNLDIAKLAAHVDRVAFTATTPAASSPPLSTISSLDIKLTTPQGSLAEVDSCEFTIDTRSAPEAAMILGEFYRRGDGWKFRAVGQGFVGGLAPLAEHFGVEIDDPGTTSASNTTPKPPTELDRATAPRPAVTPESAVESASPSEASPAINLSKISLSKAKPSVSLDKRGSSLGEIRVNLNWNQKIPGKGLFGRPRDTSVDLDLSCLFRMKNGEKGAVQALGQNFGSYDNAPWIHLLGDDRTGNVTDGEWLKINGERWDNIQLVVIFALIYEGVPNWSSTDGVITLHVPGHPDVESRMDGDSKHRVCAVAALENVNGSLKMTQENQYFKSAKELDEHYGIGLSWTAGKK
ncbi:MAG: TerD family protein [Granulosicoccus sp.]